MSLLEVKDLSVSYACDGRRLKAVDGVSLSMEAGEILVFDNTPDRNFPSGTAEPDNHKRS